jgi:hypothetical protein
MPRAKLSCRVPRLVFQRRPVSQYLPALLLRRLREEASLVNRFWLSVPFLSLQKVSWYRLSWASKPRREIADSPRAYLTDDLRIILERFESAVRT